MKKTIYTIILILFLNSSFFVLNSEAQWIRQNSGTTNNLWDVYFLNLNTGWACGDTKIFKTTNGGINWIMQITPAQSYISQIHAVDSNIVYAAGWFTFLKTTNGGTNWIGIMTGTFGSGLPVFEGLYFLNANTGWMCGSLQIQKTTDGGLTFDSVYVSAELTDIYFKNELEGVSSGEYTVYRTSNGGQTWEQSTIKDEWRQKFLRISFINNNTGFVVGSSITLKTTNFGITWDSVGRIISNQYIYSSIFTSENIGYAGGTYGVLFKTINGGKNWGAQNVNDLGNGYIKSFWAFNDSIIWAAGGGGKIIHTTTGGQWLVGINNISYEVPNGFNLCQNYPNPFNSSTKIEYSIKKSSFVKIIIFDTKGSQVDEIYSGYKQEGSYSLQYTANNLSSGVYFYSLIINNKIADTKKFVLLK